jgi:hypothetical protein
MLAFIFPLSPGSVDNTLPMPPPHVGGGPVYPGFPVDPGYGLPAMPPHVWPHPPGFPPHVWPHPPGFPPHVWPRPPGGQVDNALPISPPTGNNPGSPSNPIELPPEIYPPPGTVTPPIQMPGGGPPVIVVWVPGHGLKAFHVRLQPSNPIAGGGMAQPKS